ncbi:hypothetical protein PLICRDRAFT_180393 [Plicaturopsis crispa FD-325 SS-3]|uniref:Uncharacterized protein n=1 Tax=Plicaturopsis crispa FD-325 SS-3 TaxID=944288 RepID=A0A0C9T2J0_PLICR|nr:hypothetical protein PLICRDRAFT_180393 [Plicaturopsis crispa FD-325 SS-3]
MTVVSQINPATTTTPSSESPFTHTTTTTTSTTSTLARAAAACFLACTANAASMSGPAARAHDDRAHGLRAPVRVPTLTLRARRHPPRTASTHRPTPSAHTHAACTPTLRAPPPSAPTPSGHAHAGVHAHATSLGGRF